MIGPFEFKRFEPSHEREEMDEENNNKIQNDTVKKYRSKKRKNSTKSIHGILLLYIYELYRKLYLALKDETQNN